MKFPPRDGNLPRTCDYKRGQLVSIIAAPSATLLATAIVVAAETSVASVLAVLVALSSRLVTSSAAETAVLATGLATVKTMSLLEMSWVASVTLLRLRWWEG